jgi:sulfonate transport system substrate-binding protein
MLHRSIKCLWKPWRNWRAVLPALLFLTSLVGSFLLAGFSDTIAVGQNSRSDNPILNLVDSFKFPRNTTPRLLETVGLFIAGILFCIAIDRWFKQSTPSDISNSHFEINRALTPILTSKI